ncbi:hypothetical protein OG874_03335 [Nocardia sp. NBC_00565]|uniref:hypothetical protein n=1 Tax=Nocardia sp. NBC_00565 TaxID=2975993 RepID=UPI002E81AA5D|nr:hypothetical protein [Nocardia sp. NBC_00565]WUC04254.1 hypothetical protein OG874_03335 [Nocardia sp. NBC_00565]
MPQPRWISRSTLVVAGVFAAAALTACGSDSNPAPTGSSSTTTGSATATTAPGKTTGAAPTSLEISDASATQLCDMIRPELSNWRVQGPTLGRIGLNALVHEWALRNGGINGHVLADKAIIDRITIKSCADVHQQAIEALELKDLASGLAF